jgi:acetyltransferase-like isoleucine patch superfamily enzyme
MNNLIKTRKESYLRLVNAVKTTNLTIPNWKEILINNFPFPKSNLYIYLLRLFGMNIGKNVTILGRIHFKIRGTFENIIIGSNVIISRNVEFRNRENGVIEICDKVFLDENVRIIAAREGKVKLDTGVELGANTIINSGGTTYIGKFSLLAGFININSSSHGTDVAKFIKDQPHVHGNVHIGDDVWIGSYAAVLMNSKIFDGAVIGSHSVVIGEIPEFAIAVGVPAKVLKYRV